MNYVMEMHCKQWKNIAVSIPVAAFLTLTIAAAFMCLRDAISVRIDAPINRYVRHSLLSVSCQRLNGGIHGRHLFEPVLFQKSWYDCVPVLNSWLNSKQEFVTLIAVSFSHKTHKPRWVMYYNVAYSIIIINEKIKLNRLFGLPRLHTDLYIKNKINFIFDFHHSNWFIKVVMTSIGLNRHHKNFTRLISENKFL